MNKGLGFSELIVLIFIVLFFFKVEDIPKIIYKVGRIFAKIKNYYQQFVNEIKNEINLEAFDNENKKITQFLSLDTITGTDSGNSTAEQEKKAEPDNRELKEGS